MSAAERAGPGPGDVVVVLCRGTSRRFGSAKALAVVGADPRPLLARVAATYASTAAGLLLVVTTGDLEAGCRACLARAGVPPFAVMVAAGGGGTARTLAEAHGWLRARGATVARIWAHPVDLPRVQARTLWQLGRVADAHPLRAVRPLWGATPGHPLVLPWSQLAALAPVAVRSPGSWLEVMAAAAAEGRVRMPLGVAVSDPGTVLDHDTPGSEPQAPTRED